MSKFHLKAYSETLIRAWGIILLIIGLVGLFYGPLEIYCFYMFSAGGQFYYEGFQIGSLWFAYLTIQNASYYIVAFLMISIGIGTINLQSWGRKLSLNLFYIWLILGMAIISSLITSFQFLEKLNSFTSIIILSLMILFGIILPLIFIKIYQNAKLASIFKNKTNNFIDKIPSIILLVCSLNIIFILILHTSALFQYIFPFFGKIIIHREGVLYITSAVFILTILTYGFWKKHILAFWGLLIYYGLMFISTILTFSKYSLDNIIALLNLPQYEQQHMIPLLNQAFNFNLTALFGIFLIIMLVLIIYSEPYFFNKEPTNLKNQ